MVVVLGAIHSLLLIGTDIVVVKVLAEPPRDVTRVKVVKWLTLTVVVDDSVLVTVESVAELLLTGTGITGTVTIVGAALLGVVVTRLLKMLVVPTGSTELI
jgi:hypothetical protein